MHTTGRGAALRHTAPVYAGGMLSPVRFPVQGLPVHDGHGAVRRVILEPRHPVQLLRLEAHDQRAAVSDIQRIVDFAGQ